jgi:hypothetical protein
VTITHVKNSVLAYSWPCFEQMTLQWFSAYDSTRFLVRDDPKLSDDSGRVPKPHRVVDGLICNCEIVSLLGGNLPGGQVPLVYLKNKK